MTVLGALSPGQLARALRTAFDPYARAELAALETADPERDGLTEANAWPLGAREALGPLPERRRAFTRPTGSAAGRGVDVSPMFMDALLGRSSAVRTVAVTFEPIPPERSTREVEAAITRDRADRELRDRFGQSETARQRQAAEATMRREAELAAGHGEVRLQRLRHRVGPGPRRSAPRLRRGARARRPGAAGAAPHVRPAGRRVHVHAAAVPGAAMSRAQRRAPGPPVRRPATPRPSIRSWPPGASAAGGCSSDATPAAGRSATTRGSCTATALLDDPNAIVLGKLGQGKSALVKTLLWRMLLFGRRAFVLDVKREYGPLCEAVGRAADLARARRRRAPQPAGLAARGARPARAAARGHGDRARRPADAGRGGRAARGAARGPRTAATASRRCPRSPRSCSTPSRRWRSGCRPRPSGWPPTPAAPRWRFRICARGRCEGCSTGRPPRAWTSTPSCSCSTSTPSGTRRRSAS